MLGVAVPRRPVAVGLSLFLLIGASMPAWAAFTQTAVLRPADLPAGARFGSALAIGNGLIAVGAYLYSGNNGQRSGAVFLFDESGQPVGAPFVGRSGEQLGWSLAFLDGQLLAGAPFAQVGGARCGAVYCFDVTPAGLSNPRPLNLPCEAGAEVGTAVAVSGNLVAVGALGAAGHAGRVFVSTNGESFETLAPEGLAAGAELGASVAVDSQGAMRVVAGAPFDSAAGSSSGAAYVFERSGGAWQSTRLPGSPQPNDAFGYAVAAGGGIIAVGAPLADGQAGANAGAVSIYRSQQVWVETGRLAGRSAGDQLGAAVAIGGGGRIAAGVRRASGHGAVYVLGTDAQVQQTLQAGEPQPGAELGFMTVIDTTAARTLVAAGAFLEDQGTRRDTGAVYLFTEQSAPPPPPSPQSISLRFAAPSSSVIESAGTVAVPIQVITSDGQRTSAATSVELTACLPSDACTALEGSDFTLPSPFPIEAGTLSGQVISLPVSIQPDSQAEGDERFTVHLGPDPQVAGSFHRVTIRDDDSPGIDVEPLGAQITDESGGEASLRVVLLSEPASEVDIAVESLDPGEGTVVTPSPLRFTRDDWSTPRIVRVRGKEDSSCDGDQAYQIKLTPSSGDHDYGDLPPRLLDLVNRDNERVTVQQAVVEPEPSDLTAVYTVSVQACLNQADGAGPEVVVELPEMSHLAWASSNQGVAAMDFAFNVVDWSGALPANSTLTMTIYAGLDAPGAALLTIRLSVP